MVRPCSNDTCVCPLHLSLARIYATIRTTTRQTFGPSTYMHSKMEKTESCPMAVGSVASAHPFSSLSGHEYSHATWAKVTRGRARMANAIKLRIRFAAPMGGLTTWLLAAFFSPKVHIEPDPDGFILVSSSARVIIANYFWNQSKVFAGNWI